MDSNKENNSLPEQLKRNSFSVPEGYFNGLQEQIINNTTITGENAFTVPANYFHELPVEISNKLKTNRKIIPANFLKPVLIAASVILMVIAGNLYLKNTTDKSSLNYITYDELKNSDYLYQINEDEIIDQFQQNSSANTSAQIDFLIDNNIDLNQIELN